MSVSSARPDSQLFTGPPPAAIVLLVVLAGLAALAAALVRRRERERSGAAHLASRAELASLRVAGPGAGRVILGTHGRALIAAEARASVLVVGPSQSGKTSGLVVPALL